MADSPHSPAEALRHLKGLSGDIRAAVLLDAKGRMAAGEGEGTDAEQMAELAGQLVRRATELAGDGRAPEQIEVSVPGGSVYAITGERWTIALVAARGALSSLMFYDLRSALALLDERRAA